MLNTYANVILKRDHYQKEERHNNGHLSKLHSKIRNKLYLQGYVFISFVVGFSFFCGVVSSETKRVIYGSLFSPRNEKIKKVIATFLSHNLHFFYQNSDA